MSQSDLSRATHTSNMADHRPGPAAVLAPPEFPWAESVMSTRSLSYMSVADAATERTAAPVSRTPSDAYNFPAIRRTSTIATQADSDGLYILPESTSEIPGKLFAIADIHISYKSNRAAFESLEPRPEDGLILAGDVGETIEQLTTVFALATQHFKTVFWVPGNHELYSSKSAKEAEMHLRGEAKYMACIMAAKQYGVITPEDDFTTWTYATADGKTAEALICPIFTLYDYSFRPKNVSREGALAWAAEEGIVATDENLLHPDPYPTRDEWCARLVSESKTKLQAAQSQGLPLVIINHWPLREDTIYIPRVPRFSIWCGTKKTKHWHTRFNAKVVVTGHLHVRRTDWIDGVRFEEVSLGYPKQWQSAKDAGNDINSMMREILPGPETPEAGKEPNTEFLNVNFKPEYTRPIAPKRSESERSASSKKSESRRGESRRSESKRSESYKSERKRSEPKLSEPKPSETTQSVPMQSEPKRR
nr:hypothetical protein B0A51_02165 [Rachicladosporium sp. CCFEE 5018]